MFETYKLRVIKQIEMTLEHLEAHLPLANVHMVDYFSKEVFSTYIPKAIKEEIFANGYSNTVEAFFDDKTKHMPQLQEYIQKSRNLTLKNTSTCMSLDRFKRKLEEFGCAEINNLQLKIFMNPKKSHEVEMLSAIAAAIHDLEKTTHLIDIGDGKGYLSSMLALHYKVPVLGVDASQVKTNGAVNRAEKLSRYWNGVITNVKSKETSIGLYKQITKFVDEEVNFQELVSNVFLEDCNKIGLVGLHTCGNLASTCLKIYNKSSNIQTICNVGCCYQHLSEKGIEENKNNHLGFPLSNFIENKYQFQLGRGARMIAAQSIDRILHSREKPSKTIFYRAIFELIIKKNSNNMCFKNKQVGRFRKESPNFFDYVKKASERLKMSLEMNDSGIESLYSQYENRREEMNVFYLIRAMLAPVIESLILLDRLLYLLENGHENSFIIQLFDPVLSPRCYGIVSIKS